MSEWNYDIEKAPQGHWSTYKKKKKSGKIITVKYFVHEPCILATKCGKVIASEKQETGRWNFLATKELPVAWMAYPEYPAAK